MNCLGNKLVFPNTIPYGGLKCLFARSGLNPNQARGGGKWPQQTDFRIDLKPSCKLKFVSYIKLTKTMDQFGPCRAFYRPGSSKIRISRLKVVSIHSCVSLRIEKYSRYSLFTLRDPAWLVLIAPYVLYNRLSNSQ